MLTKDFFYELPVEQIAQRPSERRESCRMMVLNRARKERKDCVFSDLPQFLHAGDLLVLNDTKVFPARLEGRWEDTPGKVEILLLEPLATGNEWEVMMRSGRPARAGQRAVFGGGSIYATVVAAQGTATTSERSNTAHLRCEGESGSEGGRCDTGHTIVRLEYSGELYDLLEKCGETPLPPYIKRTPAAMSEEERREDAERYQTVYAEHIGAVAAPTAGLHFSKPLLEALEAQGIETAKITLHVGPGTFKPVTVENPEDHVMHSERYEVGEAAAEAINRCRARGGRIVCVGSTTVRTLETMAAEHGDRAVACSGRSALFIREPYHFVFTDAMITNFHLPESTLLMMVAALAEHDFTMESYREAVKKGYRFFSYGDCMLIE